MITAFGKKFVFGGEESTSSDEFASSDSIVPVIEISAGQFSEMFDRSSGPVKYAGRKIRYHMDDSFRKERIGNFSWALEIENIVVLIWDHKKKRIRYSREREFDDDIFRFWLLHTFYPLVLEMSGTYRVLHAASAEINKKAILFSAPSYGGKSTLVDSLLDRGYSLISDDTVAVDKRENRYYATPSYPYHRPFRAVETLGIRASNFSADSRKISAFFILHRAEADAKVSIRRVKGIESLRLLHQSIYVVFDDLKQEYLSFFANFSKSVPVYELTVPWSLERLDEVCGEIESCDHHYGYASDRLGCGCYEYAAYSRYHSIFAEG